MSGQPSSEFRVEDLERELFALRAELERVRGERDKLRAVVSRLRALHPFIRAWDNPEDEIYNEEPEGT